MMHLRPLPTLQCSAALLAEHRAAIEDDGGPGDHRLSNSLSKILYILHWMVLDSASECHDTEGGGHRVSRSIQKFRRRYQPHFQQLFQTDNEGGSISQLAFPINSVQIFVYLLAPLVHCVTEEQISSNIRLESGLPIWRALWQYRQPDLLCFGAPVKPRKSQLMFVPLIRRNLDITGTAAQGIYIGTRKRRFD